MSQAINKIIDGDIKKVLISLSLPIILSNLLQTLLGLVDMIWIGKLGSEAVSGIGTASFYLNLATALTTLVSVGAGVKIAHLIGQKNTSETQDYIKNSIVLSLVIGLIFTLVVYTFRYSLLNFFELNNATIYAYSMDYLVSSLFGIILMFLVFIFTTIFTSYGLTKITFRANLIGLIFNIIADPIFIFGFSFIPRLEVTGAAWASNIARLITLIILLVSVNSEIKASIKAKIDISKMFSMVKMSFPVTMQRLIFISISMYMAKLIITFGAEAIAVQKIGLQIESISYITIGGLQGAIATFVGQNYGSKNYKRINEGFNLALKLVIIFGISVTLLFILFPKVIFSIFISEPQIISEGANYLRIIGLSQLFMCIELLSVGAFNGIGKTFIPPIVSVILTLMRIPLAIILSKSFGLNGVWMSISLSSILKGITLLIWFKYDSKKNGGHTK